MSLEEKIDAVNYVVNELLEALREREAEVAEQRERISGLLDLGEQYARADGAKREALREIAEISDDHRTRRIARAALDVEGVSEPDQAGGGESADSRATRSGSLTSPVDTARWKCHTCGQWVADAEEVSEPGSESDERPGTPGAARTPQVDPGSLTSPVDTAPGLTYTDEIHPVRNTWSERAEP